MEQFLSGRELWSILAKLSKECCSRQMIAVPYLGKDSSPLLKFRKNDVLLCALTEQNSKAGNIYPAEIRLLQKKGVRVYQRDNLHAKIYLFGNKAVICSANLSSSSKSRLDEVGLLTNNPPVLKSIRKWFAERLVEPVTPGWLKHCENIYQPPKGGLRSPTKPKQSSTHTQTAWVIFGQLTNYPEFEDTERQRGYQTAKQFMEKLKAFYIEEFRFTGSYRFLEEINRGDLVIQAIKETVKSDYKVAPFGKLLGKKQFKNKKGTSVTYLYIEMPKVYRTMKFEKFRDICSDAGLSLGKSTRVRQISDRVQQDQILSFFSPEKLRKK